MSKKIEVKEWMGHEGEVLASDNGFDVIDCRQCGFKHLIHIPTVDELEGFISMIIMKKRNRFIWSVTWKISTGGMLLTPNATKFLRDISQSTEGIFSILVQVPDIFYLTEKKEVGVSEVLSHRLRHSNIAVVWA